MANSGNSINYGTVRGEMVELDQDLQVELSTYGGKQITVNLEEFRLFCARLELALVDLREAEIKLIFLRHALVSHAPISGGKNLEETAYLLLSRLNRCIAQFSSLTGKIKAAFNYYQEAENSAENTVENSIYDGLASIAESIWQGIAMPPLGLMKYAVGFFNGTDTSATNLATISFLLSQGMNRKDYDLRISPILGTKNTDQSAPLDSAELLAHYQSVRPRNPEEGILRVSEYQKKDGNRSWLVEIPGTQNWGINTTSPHDLSTNLRTNAGLSSDLNIAVTEVLQQAGYRQGEPLELVGHSQGAAVATALAANSVFMQKHNVVSVLAIGGNIGSVKPRGNAHILAFEQNTDVVPWLDGRSNAKVPNLTTVVGKVNKVEGIAAAHSQSRYLSLAQAAEKQKLYEVKKWNEYRLVKLGIDENTTMLSRDYQVLRKYYSEK